MATFFTSDTHFGHFNIIRYCKRNFLSLEEMDQYIIKKWNEKIGHKDEVYHLGDFAIGSSRDVLKYRWQLNGNIYLLRGNHDRGVKGDALTAFNWVKDYHELKINDREMGVKQKIILSHYAFLTWNNSHYGSWMLHGHSHGTLPESDKVARIDVGTDTNDFTPYSYEDIKFIMTKKVFKPIDRHGEK